MKLYTYFRSTAAYRVRIGLNLKGLSASLIPIHLVRGEQKAGAYTAINPNATVPTLVLDDGTAIGQSLAILEYLDEIAPEPPLLPADPVGRAKVRAAALVIVADTHPLNNTRVVSHLKSAYGRSQDDVVAWMNLWMARGLSAFQSLLAERTPFCFGERPGLADICLVGQMYNARRWGLPLDGLERLVAIERTCLALPAFDAARPEIQPDAE